MYYGIDYRTDLHFLVGTGAEISVIQPYRSHNCASKEFHVRSHPLVQAAEDRL